MNKTFAELKKENADLWKKKRELSKRCSELMNKFKNFITEENLSKMFAPYKVAVVKNDYPYSVYARAAKLQIDDNHEIKLMSWDDTDTVRDLDKKWKRDDFNIFAKLYENYAKTYEAAMENINYAKKHSDAITALLEKFDTDTTYDDYLKCYKEFYELNDAIKKNVDEAKDAFIFEKYGVHKGEIVIGQTYYLYDTKYDHKIGLVEVLSKDASGIGYKCVDHEADEKKYPHVKKSRLEEDLRDFPEVELLWGPEEKE